MNIGLIIIDMQDSFPAALHQSLRSNIGKQIILAKRRQAPILLVEYHNEGSTLPDLKSKINGYKGCYTVTKKEDDGSTEILGFLAEFPRFVPTWRVCGIHLDCCVWDTITGLKNNLKKTNIEIVRDGVHPNNFKNKTKLLSTLKRKGFNIR
jgi:hypothetical protein